MVGRGRLVDTFFCFVQLEAGGQKSASLFQTTGLKLFFFFHADSKTSHADPKTMYRCQKKKLTTETSRPPAEIGLLLKLVYLFIIREWPLWPSPFTDLKNLLDL